MKLLDRELLMKEVRPWGEPYNIVLVEEVIDLIEDTMCEVDAEKVVYCKDCKHSTILGISRLGEHHESVSYGCDLLQCNVGEDFYCAEGERRGKAK